MLGNPHNPEFGGQSRARAGRNHERRQDRAKLANQAQSDHRTQRLFASKAPQGNISLQGNDHTRKGSGKDDEQERAAADKVNPADKLTTLQRWAKDIDQSCAKKDPHATHFAQGAEGQTPTRADKAEHSSSFLIIVWGLTTCGAVCRGHAGNEASLTMTRPLP